MGVITRGLWVFHPIESWGSLDDNIVTPMITNVHAPSTPFLSPPAKRGAIWSLITQARRFFLRGERIRHEQQFVSGYEDTLTAPSDEARLLTCARLIRCHARGGRVLEIGCGEAQLMRHLVPDDYNSWLGIDASEHAIQRAQKFSNDRVHYVAAGASNLKPGDAYDAIVFSEPIYYLPDPAPFLLRYARYLAPHGVFIISIFESGIQTPVWQGIHSVAYSIGSCVVQNDRGNWTYEALRMRRTVCHVAVDNGLF